MIYHHSVIRVEFRQNPKRKEEHQLLFLGSVRYKILHKLMKQLRTLQVYTLSMKNFNAESFKNVRIQKQLSQEDIATKLFVSRTTVSNWENGKAEPDSKQLKQLEDILEVSLRKGNTEAYRKYLCVIADACIVIALMACSYFYVSLVTIFLLAGSLVFIHKRHMSSIWTVAVISLLVIVGLKYMEIHYGYLMQSPIFVNIE